MAIPLALAVANARARKSVPADIVEQALATLRTSHSPAVSAVTCAASLSETCAGLAEGVSLISNVANNDEIMKLLGVNK